MEQLQKDYVIFIEVGLNKICDYNNYDLRQK